MQGDAQVRELRRQRLRLADGVVVSAQRHRGQPGYHLQIPARGEFLAIGEQEAVFLSFLNGRRCFAEAISLAARVQGANAPTEAEALQFCTQLLKAGALQIEAEHGGSVASAPSAPPQRRSWNPFWMRMPLFNPDRLLTALRPWLGWMFHPLMAVLSGVLIVVALVTLRTRWTEFAASSQEIFDRDNWLWLGVAWLALKVLHEFSHALACKHHGGDVRETGLIFILFAPMAYVDVTASWGLRSRWQRIHIAAAGMWTELTVAAIAVLVWSQTSSPQLAHRLYNVIVLAGVTTLLFNLNPLMRFDGYYIFSDWLGLPNLASRGSEAVRRLLLEWGCGLRPAGRVETGPARWIVLTYGLAAAVWRVFVTAGLLLTAAVMFHGAGIAVAAAGWLLWCGGPLLALGGFLRRTLREEPLAIVRAGLLTSLSIGLVALPLLSAPDPRGSRVPGVIDFADACHVRTTGAGFVTAIHVQDGQRVEAGELLLELTNEELVNELRDLELQLAESEIRRVAAVNANELGEAQIEIAVQAGLLTRRNERLRQVESLQIRAPRSGAVVARRLSERLATYVAEGEELCVLGDDAAKEVVVAIDQTTARKVVANDVLTVRSSSGDEFSGRIARLTPRAQWTSPHPGLLAVNGGSLASRAAAGHDAQSDEQELVEPVIEARLSLDLEASRQLNAGQLCDVSTTAHTDPLGTVVYRAAAKWIRAHLEPDTSRSVGHRSIQASGRDSGPSAR